MSTIQEDNFNYQTYTRENPPDPTKIQRGIEARERRREAATPETVVGIEDDIIAEFKQIVPQEQEYRRLINQALREWLIAKDVKELVRAELQKAIRQALSSIPNEVEQSNLNETKSFVAEEKEVLAEE